MVEIGCPAIRHFCLAVGNSNVVSIPREFEARGYAAGTSVLVEELEGGELRIIPTEQVRDRIRGIGQRVVDEQDRKSVV